MPTASLISNVKNATTVLLGLNISLRLQYDFLSRTQAVLKPTETKFYSDLPKQTGGFGYHAPFSLQVLAKVEENKRYPGRHLNPIVVLNGKYSSVSWMNVVLLFKSGLGQTITEKKTIVLVLLSSNC